MINEDFIIESRDDKSIPSISELTVYHRSLYITLINVERIILKENYTRPEGFKAACVLVTISEFIEHYS